MVTVILLMMALLPGRELVAGSGFPKDSTTAWCSKVDSQYVYRCYPNPWGSGRTLLYVRFPDSSGINGCLRGRTNFRQRFQPGAWIFIGGASPYLPKLTLDQDLQCLEQTKTVNTAVPGDSVEMEFWFTPGDTVVSDTIRGTFKAWYRGNKIAPEFIHPHDPERLVRWTRSGLASNQPLEGPFRLADLRGRICPLRFRPSGDGVLLIPTRRLEPGLYHLTWPQGQTTVFVPGD